MAVRKRRRRSTRELAVAEVAKIARRERLAFERNLSQMIGEALGLEVTVKLKGKAVSPASARAKRQPKKKAGAYYEELEEMLDGANAAGVDELRRVEWAPARDFPLGLEITREE